jgi:hypothetical protein
VREIDLEQLGLLGHEQRDRACALRLLAGAAALVFRDVRTHDDTHTVTSVTRCVTDSGFERVHAAQARVLELGHFHVPRQARTTERLETTVHHAAHDDRARGVVGARLSAQTEEPDLRGVDVVVLDQTNHGVCRHRVDVLVATGHPKAPTDDRLDLVPGIAGPTAPVFQAHAQTRHVDAHAADPRLHCVTHLETPLASRESFYSQVATAASHWSRTPRVAVR